MRRSASFLVVAAGVMLLLGLYVVYNLRVLSKLRHEVARSARMYARVYEAMADPSADNSSVLFRLSRDVVESGVPLVVTDAQGKATNAANTPYDSLLDDPRMREYILRLDREHLPIVETGVFTVHVGDTPLVEGLRVIPFLMTGLLAFLLVAGIYILRVRERADREKVWAGMARESAHQLGTPLSSLAGWVELLGDRDGDPVVGGAVTHMRGDLERLERVAHRFERIGRPPHREPVNVGDLVDRTAAYFRARVPTLAHSVTIAANRGEDGMLVEGDEVLLEWALEALMKNAVDALAGRGGRIYISAERTARGVQIRVADDGPGIPRELRAKVFDPGFSTKERGWGVGLSLARRIVEESHGGRLLLVPSHRGATFDVILP